MTGWCALSRNENGRRRNYNVYRNIRFIVSTWRHCKLHWLFPHCLCGFPMRRTARPAAFGYEVAVPRGCKAISNKLESGGTEYPNRKHYNLAGEPATAGAVGPQEFINKAPDDTAAGHSGAVPAFGTVRQFIESRR